MWAPELGAILLVSPVQDALGWALLGLGIAAGLASPAVPKFLHIPPHWIQFPCLGAALWCVSRDFALPLDTVLLACLPVAVIQWRATRGAEILLVLALIFNYVWFASPAHPVRDHWTPAVHAALLVARSQDKLQVVGLVLARHLVPAAAHVLYGAPLFFARRVEVPFYDATAGPALLTALFAVLAHERWFHYMLAAFSILQYISV